MARFPYALMMSMGSHARDVVGGIAVTMVATIWRRRGKGRICVGGCIMLWHCPSGKLEHPRSLHGCASIGIVALGAGGIPRFLVAREYRFIRPSYREPLLNWSRNHLYGWSQALRLAP